MINKKSFFPRLKEVRERREALNLTQEELARKSGVSQSTIAKIESQSINPSYEIMRKIFTTLQRVETEREKKVKAKDVMTEEIISVQKDEKMKEAVTAMKKYGYSQLPVLEGEKCVGSISESSVLNLVTQEEKLNGIYEMKVKELMEDAFPRISMDTPLSIVMSLLSHSPAILVTQRGKIVGIITKADLIDIGWKKTQGK